ncbi:MAG: MBL fold metallo-hydrolase [Desulfobacca sp.]|uniref:MBL fold metallo-hydrolase n=1 Tax=Desulfobacca sp. TaxID=2067990 RepID=UPI00404A3643
MEVIIIGSGTAVPSRRRGSPAVAVQAGETLLLMDIGPGTLRAMLNYGLDFNDIDVLCLSHHHPDHVADLVAFLFASRYRLGYNREKPVWLVAAQGFQEFHQRLKGVWGEWLEPPAGLLQVQEIATAGVQVLALPELRLRTAPVQHLPTSLAFRVEYGGRAVVYSGDTDWSEDLIHLAQGADLLILEAANPWKVPGHLTPAEAGRLAARAGVPRLVLTHFYPPCDTVDVAAACRQEFGGNIILAEDGLRITV